MNRVVLLIGLLFFSISSCDRGAVYDKFKHIEDAKWRWDEPVSFTVPVNDTTDLYNILIRLRHTTDYPLSNLYMFVDLEGPEGQEHRDTINFKLAENSGKWIGKGVGNIRELGYLYRANTRFPQPGAYTFSIEQAMRLSEVPVSEIGLRVERIIQ